MLLEQLRSLKLIVELDSVSKAAEAQHTVQPAVSRQLKQLQELFNYPLFYKSGKKLRLTSFGQLVYDQAKNIIKYTDSLINMQKIYEEQLVVGGSLTSLPIFLPEVISSFREQFEAIKLSIRTGTSSDIHQSLLDGIIDIGIVSYPIENPLITSIHLFDDPLELICKSDSPWSEFDQIPVESLHRKSIILSEKGMLLTDNLERMFKLHNITPEVTMRIDNFEIAKNMIKAGLGVSILPKSTCISEFKSGELHSISLITNQNKSTFNISRKMSLISLDRPTKPIIHDWIDCCLKAAEKFI